jgi:exosortase
MLTGPGTAADGATQFTGAHAATQRTLVPVLTVYALIALAVLSFLPEFRLLAHVWATQPGSSQGPLIAVIALGLIWTRRHELIFEPSSIAVLPLVGLVIAIAAWVAARAASIGFAEWALWPLILVFAIRLALGARAARCIALPAAYFLLALPIIGVFAAPLQTLTATAASLPLHVVGLSPVIQGRYVTIPEGSFEIAEGCAGTHFLTAALATGTLFAVFLGLPFRRAMLVVVGSVLVGLVANWLRVALVIEIGHVTAMQSSLVRDHHAFGWLIFTALLLAFLLVARTLSVGDAAPKRRDTALLPSPPAVARAICIGAVALVVTPLWAAIIDHAASGQALPDSALPALRGLEGPTRYQADWRPSFPGAASERAGEYRLGAAPIEVYSAFYSVQAHGAKLFGSDSSIAGRGPWKERARRLRQLPGAAIETILVDDEGQARLVWHWFEVRGERLTSGAQVKLRQSLAAFGLPARSGVVAISARCEPDCSRAEALLAEVYRRGLGNWTVSAPLRGVTVQAGTGRRERTFRDAVRVLEARDEPLSAGLRHDLNPGASQPPPVTWTLHADGPRAWLEMPVPFWESDWKRPKDQIDLLLTEDEHAAIPRAPPDLSIRTAIALRVVQSPNGLYRRWSPTCILGFDSRHPLHFPGHCPPMKAAAGHRLRGSGRPESRVQALAASPFAPSRSGRHRL